MIWPTEESYPLRGLQIGTASSATQIEGGESNHNWYQWAQLPGNVRDGSSPFRATDHWTVGARTTS